MNTQKNILSSELRLDMSALLDPAQALSRGKLMEHCLTRIRTCFRPAQGLLKHPFLVPGGIFHDELWDWDSFWIVKGLCGVLDRMDSSLRYEFLKHAKGGWLNFLEHQAWSGAIPIMVKSTAADPFGCTSDSGIECNQAKPILGQYALELSLAFNDFSWLENQVDGLMRFYSRWRSRYRSDCGLLVWGSDVAIGVDNDPTTYGRPEFSSANLLLNCLYYKDLVASIEILSKLGRLIEADQLSEHAEDIKDAILRECWDPVDRFFYSVDVRVEDLRDHYLPRLKKGMPFSWRTMQLKVKMFTGFLPLWSGIASPEQARELVEKHLKNPAEFNSAWGVPSLAKNERMYDPATNSAHPSNWLGPVWIVANYTIYEGLLRYGYLHEAAELAGKIHHLLEGDLQKTKTLHECYHPETGEPNFNADFLSWNVLSLIMSSQVKSRQ